MSPNNSIRVQKLQTALHAKAKESPNIRLHALYDQVYRKDVSGLCYERGKANGGAAGVDKQTFGEHSKRTQGTVVDELAQELKSRTYQHFLLRRVLPTQAGWEAETVRHRQSGIGLRKPRPCWYSNQSSRPTCRRSNMPIGRTAARWKAVQHVHKTDQPGHGQIVDADLSSYFEMFPCRAHEVGSSKVVTERCCI